METIERKKPSPLKRFQGLTRHNIYNGQIQCTKCGYTTDSGSGNNNRKCPKGGSCTWRVVLR
jgi:predicted Zn-ribbon and HTH transcriptional regulator